MKEQIDWNTIIYLIIAVAGAVGALWAWFSTHSISKKRCDDMQNEIKQQKEEIRLFKKEIADDVAREKRLIVEDVAKEKRAIEETTRRYREDLEQDISEYREKLEVRIQGYETDKRILIDEFKIMRRKVNKIIERMIDNSSI